MITKETYRDYPAIHYSLLSKVSRDPTTALSENKDFSDGMMFGDALDILLTQSQEEFDKRYIVAAVERPTGQMGDFIDAYYKFGDEEIAYNNVGFKRDSLSKVLHRFEDEGRDYYHFLHQCEGKKVIPVEMLMKVNEAINTLKTHPFTREYFDYNIGTSDMIWFEKHHQFPILFKVKDIECKALLDKVFINHTHKS